MHILVDMDGVLANWGKHWDEVLDKHYPVSGVNIPRHHQQKSFDLMDGLTPEERNIVEAVMAYPGFYRDLEPMPGALQAVLDMVDAGHEVFIVTSPWHENPDCASEKLAWVKEHLGTDWLPRLIITKDKTLIHGDILIDDKPEVTGARTPEWEHIIFNQPYNVTVTGKRRLSSWLDWEKLIKSDREAHIPLTTNNYFFGIDPTPALVRDPDVVIEESVNGQVLPAASEALEHDWLVRDPDETVIPASARDIAQAEHQRNLTAAVARLNSRSGVTLDHTEVGPMFGIERRPGESFTKYLSRLSVEANHPAAPATNDLSDGEVRVTSSTGGQKGKKLARFDLIPVDALTQLAEHYGRGAAKYDDNQWRKGYEWSLSYAALQRHLTAWWGGEDLDPETGSNHIAAVAWHAFALLTYIKDFPEHDDRFKGA